jgi:hypothetical protein
LLGRLISSQVPSTNSATLPNILLSTTYDTLNKAGLLKKMILPGKVAKYSRYIAGVMSSVGLSPRVFISEHPVEVRAGKFTYRRWVVQSSAKQYGKRIRRFAATRKEAEIMKAQLEDRISVDREKTANVEHGDRLEALKALETLTGRATLTEAAQFWIDHHPDKRVDPFTPDTLKQAIDWYLIDKRKNGCKPRYVRDLRFTLEKVNRTFSGALSLAITQEKFERWLDQEKMTSLTRRAYIRDVSGLLRFCVYKRWIKENPLEHIRRPKIKLHSPEIFSVDGG